MSNIEEILTTENPLSRHLVEIGLGYEEFETCKSYGKESESSISNGLNPFICFNVKNKIIESKTNKSKVVPITFYDHFKLTSILNSKLLLSEDLDFLDYFSLIYCSPIHSFISKSYLLRGLNLVAASLSLVLSVAYIPNVLWPQKNIYVPLSISAFTSFYAMNFFYKHYRENKKTKEFASYIEIFQRLCISSHKILQFLKETEILSTGQVSTNNIGSAMYIPLNSSQELNEFQLWKVLPYLRKDLVDSLIDLIRSLSHASDSIKKFTPYWLAIKGFTLSSQISQKETQAVIKNVSDYKNGNIPLKDLQILCDIYLVAQSELLKWIAFCMCPIVWTNSLSHSVHCRTEILQILNSTMPKLSNISFKLQSQLDLQTICLNSEQNKYKSNPVNKELQEELHKTFSLVFSAVQKAKILEDCTENISNGSSRSGRPICHYKESFSHQFNSLRSELTCAVKHYDHIYNEHCLKTTLKNRANPSDCSVNSGFIMSKSNKCSNFQDKDTAEVPASLSDFSVSSPDEVFLAITGSKSEESQSYFEEWCLEKRPEIPKTLLPELSSILKPIKKDFIERERLALERVGVQDIKCCSRSEDQEERKSEVFRQSHLTSSERKINTSKFRPILQDEKSLVSSTNSGDEDETEHRKLVDNETKTGLNSSHINSLLLSNLIKLESEKRGKIKEEHFCDD